MPFHKSQQTLRQQNEYLAALHDTTLAVMNRLERNDVLQTIVERAGTLFGTAHGYIYLVDDTHHLSMQIGTGVYSHVIGVHLQRGVGLAGMIWQTGEPMTVANYSGWHGRATDFDQFQFYAVAGVPLTSGNTVVGVLGLGYLDPQLTFGAVEMLVLGRFGQLASVALDNAHLYMTSQRELAERSRAETALRESEARYRALFDAAQRQTQELQLLDKVRTLLARELDLSVLIRTIVEAIAETFGYTLVSIYLIREGVLVLQHQVGYKQVLDNIPLAVGVMGRVARTGEPALVEDEQADPTAIWAFEGLTSEVCVPFKDDKEVVGVLNVESTQGIQLGPADLQLMLALSEHVNIAITRARLYTQVRESQSRYRAVVDNVKEVIYQTDARGCWTLLNPAWTTITGWRINTSIGAPAVNFVHQDDRKIYQAAFNQVLSGSAIEMEHEFRLLTHDGSIRWVEAYARILVSPEGVVIGSSGTLSDVTERKRAEAAINQLAYYDSLTQLPNRVLFHRRLSEALSQAQQHEQEVALLFLDLDRFKVINDTLGHHVGDLLLQNVALRLKRCIRSQDMVARMGGDEFTVILPNIAGPAAASEVAQRIICELATPFVLEGHELVTTPSIGISIYPGDGLDVDTLLKRADIAMYRAKDHARNSYQFFAPTMHPMALEQLELEQQLRRALDRQEFVVFYQPRLQLHTGRVTGMEALVRWQHPQRGLVGPGEFIPLAEESGLIVSLGDWVLRTACAQAKLWQTHGFPPLRIAVNLSARQLHQPDVVERVVQALADTGLEPHYLELEITESTAIQHFEHTIEVLRAVKAMGVHVSLDDFGTGYSSLSYLKQFPLDTLKLDQSFVRNLLTNPQDAAIAEAVIALAHNLNLSVTAEGVETEAQRSFLQARHCDEVQGYLIGKPMPAADFAQFVTERLG